MFNPFRVGSTVVSFPVGYHQRLFKLNPFWVFTNKSPKDLNMNNLRWNRRHWNG